MESCGISKDRISVIGVGTDELAAADRKSKGANPLRSSDGPIVAFVSRLVSGKGLDVLLQAMPVVWGELPSTTFLIAGPSGEGSDEILRQHRAILQQGGRRVRFLGYVGGAMKSAVYDVCDVFTLPSETESFGIVYIEAWAYGKPVIGCPLKSTARLISDGVDGLLVPFGDSLSLANAIIHLLKNPQLAISMGEAGRAKVRRSYTWDVVGAKVVSAYARLLGGPEPKSFKSHSERIH